MNVYLYFQPQANEPQSIFELYTVKVLKLKLEKSYS